MIYKYHITSIDSLANTVKEWADIAFPNRTDGSMALKLYSEIGEMIESGGDPLEIADVLIMVLDYAARKDVDIESAVLTKLEINRARTWTIDPETGVSRHV